MEIGVDIIDLKRLDIDNTHFIERVLTADERVLFYQKKSPQQKREFLGGRFAAKEAYVKALGTGIGKVGFQQIEVLNDELGKPYIKGAKVSISHEKEYAVAFVVIE